MKPILIASMLAPLALAACSTSTGAGTTGAGGTTGSGTTTGASDTTTITFTTVDVHPAAKAALAAIGFPVPSITDGTYQIALKGVSVLFVGTTPTIELADAGFTTITSTTGPYAFPVSNDFLLNSAGLGVLGGVNPIVSTPLVDGGLIEPTCPQWTMLKAGVQGVIADGGSAAEVSAFLSAQNPPFNDYLVPTGLLVGGIAQAPTADVPNAVAYAIPMSYAVILNCAGKPNKTTRDTDIGGAVVYVTNGTGPGQGTPVAGAVTPLKNAAGNPPPTATYYQNNYSATETIATNLSAATDSTGIATFLDVSPLSTTPPTITVQGAAGLTFTADYGISTQPNAFFSIVAYPH